MPAPTITPLPTPPSRSQSPDTFSTDADAFLGALPDFATEANDQAEYLDDLATAVDADAAAAVAAASIATGAANYQGDYNAGTTYQIGESVSYSGRRYVAKTVNTGVTPADGANWFLINDGDVLGPASATSNGIALYDGTTGKIIKSGLNNGTLGQVLTSGGAGNAPTWENAAKSGEASYVAYGSISAGNYVALRNDGKVEVVTGSIVTPEVGTQTTVSADDMIGTRAIYAPGIGVIVVYGSGGGSEFKCRVGTVSGTSIAFGNSATLSTYGTSYDYWTLAYHPIEQRAVLISGQGTNIYAWAISFSAGVATFGSLTSYSTSGSPVYIVSVYDSIQNRILFHYDASSTHMNYLTLSGSTITFGSATTLGSGSANRGYTPYTKKSIAFDPVSGLTLITYLDNGAIFRALPITHSSNTFTYGTAAAFKDGQTHVDTQVVYDSDNACFIAIAAKNNASWVSALKISLSGTTAVIGASTDGITSLNYTAQRMQISYDSVTRKFFVLFNGTANYIGFVYFSFNGTDFSVELRNQLWANTGSNLAVAYESANDVFVPFYTGSASPQYYVHVAKPGATSTNANNFIGIAAQNIADGATGAITIQGGTNTNVSGLTANTNYYITYNGQASTTATGYRKIGYAINPTSMYVDSGFITGSASPFAVATAGTSWVNLPGARGQYSFFGSYQSQFYAANAYGALQGDYAVLPYPYVNATYNVMTVQPVYSKFYDAWFSFMTVATTETWLYISKDGYNFYPFISNIQGRISNTSWGPTLNYSKPNLMIDESNGRLWTFHANSGAGSLTAYYWNYGSPKNASWTSASIFSGFGQASFRFCKYFNTGNVATSALVFGGSNTSQQNSIWWAAPGSTSFTQVSLYTPNSDNEMLWSYDQPSGKGWVKIVGQAHAFYFTSSAQSWSTNSSTGLNTSSSYQVCATGNGYFVSNAASNNTLLRYSQNGTTWTDASSGVGDAIQQLWFSNGNWYAATSTQVFRTSSTIPNGGWVSDPLLPVFDTNRGYISPRSEA